jgi:hypothetical protein
MDALGALNGTHLLVYIPDTEPQKLCFQNQKGRLSQNVLAVVDFDMNFLFVLPGWEGSAHDSRVLKDVQIKGFEVYRGCYYLAHSGYSSVNPAVLTPYQKTQYHLREQAQASLKLANAEELFNLCHTQFCNVVERAFGVFKQRFKWFSIECFGYSFKTQVKMVYALTALSNFMNQNSCNPEDEVDLNEEEEFLQDEELNMLDYKAIDMREMKTWRDEIAEAIWDQYKNIH